MLNWSSTKRKILIGFLGGLHFAIWTTKKLLSGIDFDELPFNFNPQIKQIFSLTSNRFTFIYVFTISAKCSQERPSLFDPCTVGEVYVSSFFPFFYISSGAPVTRSITASICLGPKTFLSSWSACVKVFFDNN